MTHMLLTLFCLVDGETTYDAFSVEIDTSETVDHLKNVIKSKKINHFSHVNADKLSLWRVSIPIPEDYDEIPILLNDVTGDKKKLGPMTRLSEVFPKEIPEKTIHITVQQPPFEATWKKRYGQDPEFAPPKKRFRSEQAWAPFVASDGHQVDLPLTWIRSEFIPEPRAAFAYLRNAFQPGVSIVIPDIGQTPKGFRGQGLAQTLFITEQMLELWEDI
ncbi:hypothetical protein BG004_002987, partial [Podila humilis]